MVLLSLEFFGKYIFVSLFLLTGSCVISLAFVRFILFLVACFLVIIIFFCFFRLSIMLTILIISVKIFIHGSKNKFFNIFAIKFHLLASQNFDFIRILSLLVSFCCLLKFDSNRFCLMKRFLSIFLVAVTIKRFVVIEMLFLILFWIKLKTVFMITIRM